MLADICIQVYVYNVQLRASFVRANHFFRQTVENLVCLASLLTTLSLPDPHPERCLELAQTTQGQTFKPAGIWQIWLTLY